jgi:hypothetical protein
MAVKRIDDNATRSSRGVPSAAVRTRLSLCAPGPGALGRTRRPHRRCAPRCYPSSERRTGDPPEAARLTHDDIRRGRIFTRMAREPKRARTSSKPRSFEDARFLNIDLEVRSRRSLAPLAVAWPWCYQPLTSEGRPSPGWLILNPRRIVPNAEAAAKELLRHIRALRGDGLRCWRQAHTRTFDIGIQAGGPGKSFEDVRLTSETLRLVADVGATVRVTVYPAEPLSGRPTPSGRPSSAG